MGRKNMQCTLIYLMFFISAIEGQEWPPPNYIDFIQATMDAITPENCENAAILELRLPLDTLAQLPTYEQISEPEYKVPENRSDLVYLHNVAMNRGFYFSFIHSQMNESKDFSNQPDWLYYYISTWSDSTSSGLKGSGIFYDQNKTYANWYEELPFNRTLGLFGPRTWKEPQCFEWNPLCKSLNEYASSDYGAGPNNNYTLPSYKQNPWYEMYLPDDDPALDNVIKSSYLIRLKYANATESHYKVFFGVKREEFMPVTFTVPYYDCNRSNKWIVSAVSPFVDYIPRYLEWYHLRRHMFTGVSVQDIEFESIDINPCPFGIGNELPNAFAGTAMCKSTTTCEPLSGFGFQRGGYQCRCQPGLIYPPGQNGPFQGRDIENSTREDYEQGFDCEEPYRLDVQKENFDHKKNEFRQTKRKHKIPRYQFHPTKENQVKKYDDIKMKNLTELLTLDVNTVQLPLEMSYNVESEFQIQAKMASRLANFLSSYIQNASPEDTKLDDPGFSSDNLLHIDHIYGEVISNVMADIHIKGSGVYFDAGKFISSENDNPLHFAPYATESQDPDDQDYSVVDAAEFNPIYTEELWFIDLKEKWENTANLVMFEMDAEVRSDVNGINVTTLPRSPLSFYGTNHNEGLWTSPYSNAVGLINKWVVTYVTPFFGYDSSGTIIEFH